MYFVRTENTMNRLARPARSTRILASDGHCTVAYDHLPPNTTLEEVAAMYCKDYPDADAERGTYWVNVRAWYDGEELSGRNIKVSMHPPTPPCREAGGHIFDHVTTYPSRVGRGVVMVDTCTCCGIERRTDSSAQDPQDGTDGHPSIRYVFSGSEEAEDAAAWEEYDRGMNERV